MKNDTVTEEQQVIGLDGALGRRNDELALLNRIAAATTATLEPMAVLETVCRELETLGQAGSAAGAEEYVSQIEAEHGRVEPALPAVRVQDDQVVIHQIGAGE